MKLFKFKYNFDNYGWDNNRIKKLFYEDIKRFQISYDIDEELLIDKILKDVINEKNKLYKKRGLSKEREINHSKIVYLLNLSTDYYYYVNKKRDILREYSEKIETIDYNINFLYFEEFYPVNKIKDKIFNKKGIKKNWYTEYIIDNELQKFINDYKINDDECNIMNVYPKYCQDKVNEKIRKLSNNKIDSKAVNIMHSNEEKEIYEMLCKKYGENNVLKEYICKEYPFHCDFYIKPLDLYIEYQGYISHNNMPYIGTVTQQRIVENYKNKKEHKEYYKSIINTWTFTDVVKRQWAKIHELNWVEFFNLEDFNNWIKIT